MHDFLGSDPIVCERLTLTLLHFLWQGAAIGVVAAVLSEMLLRASSQVRYMIHLAALLVMCGCLPITFLLVSVPDVAVVTAKIGASPTVSTTNDRPVSNSLLPVPGTDAKPSLSVSADSTVLADASVLPGQQISLPKPSTAVMTNSGAADSVAGRYLPLLAPYVTAIYLTGVVLLLVRLLRSAWITRRLGRSAAEVSDIELLCRMRTQAERLGLRVLPALRWCHQVPVPVVIGVLRPMVLLPAYAATGLTMDQLQAVIAHELAHICRYDLVANVLQRVIESLLFFHPAVWWVSRQITNEREQACDELVLTVGTGRVQYADALVRMAELSCQLGRLPVTALATTGYSTTVFKRRILRVLEIDTDAKIRPSRIAAVTASLVVVLTLAMLLSGSGASATGGMGEDRDRAAGSSEDDERAAWRELDSLRVFFSASGRPGWIENLKQSISRNDQKEAAKYQKLLDEIPKAADFWQIPAEAWPVIGRLTSLTDVRFVASNGRGQVRHLSQLKNLKKFDWLNGEFLPADLEKLAALADLEVIEVRLTTLLQPVETIEELIAALPPEENESFQNWKKLDFERAKSTLAWILTDRALQELHHLKKLRHLKLTLTYVTGTGVEQLAHFPNLETFSIDEWYLLTPESMRALGSLKNLRRFPRLPSGATELIEPLAGLQKLEELAIDGGDLTDEGLSHIKNLNSLKRLDILRSQVTDTGLMHLANLKQLEQLDIRGVDAVTKAGLQQLRKRLPNCRIIHTDVDYNALIVAKEDPIAQPPSIEVQANAVAGLEAEITQSSKAADRPHFDLQVVDDVTRQPIAGAEVRVRQYVSDRQPNNVTPPKLDDVHSRFLTDARATFPITFPAEMQGLLQYLQISVRHPDYVIEQSFGARQVTAEMADDVVLAKKKLYPTGVIALKRGFEVSGQVLLADGKPAPDVAVYAAWQMPIYLNMPPHAVTDANGRYKFRTMGGSSDENHLMFIPEFRDPTAGTNPKTVDLASLPLAGPVAQSIRMQEAHGEHPLVQLQSGTRITGVVRDAAGNALSNVIVQANGSDSVYTGFPNVMSCVVTDAEGRYALPAQQLPVDVRVARWGGLGGWSLPTQLPKDVYVPQLVTEDWPWFHAGGKKLLEVDFKPVKTVTLRAQALNPQTDILLMAHVPLSNDQTQKPGPRWMRRFEKVPGQVGLFELKVPHGLIQARIDLTSEGLQNPAVTTWSRAPHPDEQLNTPRTSSPWPILNRDDDSIIIGESAR